VAGFPVRENGGRTEGGLWIGPASKVMFVEQNSGAPANSSAALWGSEQPPDWETLQPLPFPYSTSFRPKYLIDSPECKFILLRCAFKGGYSAV